MHHSGALLLEARDGEFLDEQLCCSSVAASTCLQQPDQQAEQMRDAGHEAMDTGHSFGDDEAEGISHDYDDGAGGADNGDDYMQQDPADLDGAGVSGLLSNHFCGSTVLSHVVCELHWCCECMRCLERPNASTQRSALRTEGSPCPS